MCIPNIICNKKDRIVDLKLSSTLHIWNNTRVNQHYTSIIYHDYHQIFGEGQVLTSLHNNGLSLRTIGPHLLWFSMSHLCDASSMQCG